MIPRPETEFLTEHSIKLIIEAFKKVTKGKDRLLNPPLRILDLCTGSGCIALLCQHRLEEAGIRAEITAVDKSQASLELANKNLAALNAASIKSKKESVIKSIVREMDIFNQKDVNQLMMEGGPFDVIISNPPYIPTIEWETLDECVRRWEDSQALIGDVDGVEDGLAFYRRIANLTQTSKLLSNRYGGMPSLIVEVGHDQGQKVQEIFNATGGFAKTALWIDPWQVQRGVIAWNSRNPI